MTTYPQQFLYMVNQYGNAVEIVNAARAMTNMDALRRSNVTAASMFTIPSTNAGCPALIFEPCTTVVTAPVTVTTTTWALADMSTGGAPWNDGSAEAGEAVGITITDWTGLDAANQGRATYGYGTAKGGAWFGPLSQASRIWKINVVILGVTERGCNYMFRWLEQQLWGCCGEEGTSAWFREYCPAQSALFDGLSRAEDVSLIEGLTWLDQPLEDGGCVIRAASFTLGVGDPCLYRNEGQSVTVSTILKSSAVALAPVLIGDRTIGAACGAWTSTGIDVSQVVTRPRYGASSAIVTISSSSDGPGFYLPDMRVIGHVDRAGVGTVTPCTNSVYSQVVLTGVPAGVIVEVDLARRTVRQKGGRDDYDWSDATGFVRRAAGARTKWASFPPCDAGAVTVEPFSKDQFVGIDASDLVANWSVNITEKFKYGCASC